MKPTFGQQNDFLDHQPLFGVLFEHNDAVEITEGAYAGEFGVLISVEDLGDDPLYLVELNSGRDACIRQSSLRSLKLPP